MKKVRRAILSVFLKDGLAELGRFLAKMNVEILSSGGTSRFLKEHGIEVTEISSLTGFPEILDGRVKTLHPKVHGGILADRRKKVHLEEMDRHGIPPIDLVVVNLYPFVEVAARENVTMDEAVENIDIGGPAMLRAAAKNWQSVAVVCDPGDYAVVMEEMMVNDGAVREEIRRKLAAKVFAVTAAYDAAIQKYLAETKDVLFPPVLSLTGTKVQDLRYGENPHQRAAFFRDSRGGGLASSKKIQGKELSFNNLLDLDAAYQLVNEFDGPAAVVIKHTNPCGAATGESLLEAFQKAVKTDPLSSFGGIVGFNRTVDKDAAEALAPIFLEAVIAPRFEEAAGAVLQKKKNLRVLEAGYSEEDQRESFDIKRISGGFLVQERNLKKVDPGEFRVVTRRKPTDEELRACIFAWRVVRHVKSNAVIFTREDRTVAVGAGQMSRVDSAKVAVMKASEPLTGTSVGSDAFFPFRDGVDEVARAGATAIIQPGGSVRDQEVIEAADGHNLAMIFTGWRQFRH
jgi:phosphoribosylaminoimidazolecarboxamide formyltransferase/IMP cyclohydrolase